jgi:hypothetical protein
MTTSYYGTLVGVVRLMHIIASRDLLNSTSSLIVRFKDEKQYYRRANFFAEIKKNIKETITFPLFFFHNAEL